MDFPPVSASGYVRARNPVQGGSQALRGLITGLYTAGNSALFNGVPGETGFFGGETRIFGVRGVCVV